MLSRRSQNRCIPVVHMHGECERNRVILAGRTVSSVFSIHNQFRIINVNVATGKYVEVFIMLPHDVFSFIHAVLRHLPELISDKFEDSL